MVIAKRNQETRDLGKFVQSAVGGELILGDGQHSFTLRINQNVDLRNLMSSIQKFYQSRGYETPHSNELHFTKGHQRRTIYLTTEGPEAYVTISNPDGR